MTDQNRIDHVRKIQLAQLAGHDQNRIDHVRKITGEELQRLLNTEGQKRTVGIDCGSNGATARLSMRAEHNPLFEVIEPLHSDEQIQQAVQRLFNGKSPTMYQTMRVIIARGVNRPPSEQCD